MIKFLNLYQQDKKLHRTIINKIHKLFKKGDFILGKEVKIFEKNFGKFCNSKYTISCANGTDALTLALKSLNLPYNSAFRFALSFFVFLFWKSSPFITITTYLMQKYLYTPVNI